MSNVINLKQQRKIKARSEKEKKAAANRATFGQTKEEKLRKKKEKERIEKHLDGHKMDKDE